MKRCLASFVFVLLLLCLSGTSVLLRDIKFGKCNISSSLTGLLGISLKECVNECLKRPDCRSVNYARHTMYCDLNRRAFSDNELMKCILFVHVEVRPNGQILSDVLDPCFGLDCSAGSVCEYSTCEIKECHISNVSTLQNGFILGNSNHINAKRTLKCRHDHVLIGMKETVCQNNGSWTPVGSCERVCKQPKLATGQIISSAVIVTENDVIPSNDTDLISSTSFFLNGSEITLACVAPEVISGNNMSTCVDGKWTKLATCILRGIGQTCAVSEDCEVPASECRDGKCRCDPTRGYSVATNECVTYCNTFANTFQEVRGMKLSYKDDEIHYSITLEECSARCLSATVFVCQSFEFSLSNDCYISKSNANDGSFRAADGYTYYHRDCLT